MEKYSVLLVTVETEMHFERPIAEYSGTEWSGSALLRNERVFFVVVPNFNNKCIIARMEIARNAMEQTHF